MRKFMTPHEFIELHSSTIDKVIELVNDNLSHSKLYMHIPLNQIPLLTSEMCDIVRVRLTESGWVVNECVICATSLKIKLASPITR